MASPLPLRGKLKARQLEALVRWRTAYVVRPGQPRQHLEAHSLKELRVGDLFRLRGCWFYYGERELYEIISDKMTPMPREAYSHAAYYPGWG
jgi:hypothetical protein